MFAQLLSDILLYIVIRDRHGHTALACSLLVVAYKNTNVFFSVLSLAFTVFFASVSTICFAMTRNLLKFP